jgi:hypothetical protein
MSDMRAALLQGRPICPSIHRTLEYSEAFARRKGRTRPVAEVSRGVIQATTYAHPLGLRFFPSVI